MKNLPIGIQTIQEIITDGYIYVDKTQFALELIQTGKHYFLSRPRRFGKSLFVSTLKEIFKGNKALFEGCHIAQSNYDWKPHPVLLLNFGDINNKTPEKLEVDLRDALNTIGEEQGIEVVKPSLESHLKALIKALAKKGRVVVLIDEYDKPLIDHLHSQEVAEGNRQLLQDFFGALKNLDEYIKFTFITGISKFSKVSLFSGANHLNDISMDAQYAAMMGYTQEELVQYFGQYVQAIVQKKNQQGKPSTEEEVLAEIKDWYNGYRFSEEEIYVYNPFSTLSYFRKKKAESYWFATGTPFFLTEQIKKYSKNLVPLSGTQAKDDELMSSGSITEIDIKALMFQSGYLTIESYNEKTQYYQLVFPNKEVRKAFIHSLVKHFAKLNAKFSAEMRTLLDKHNLTVFFEKIKLRFNKFPYQTFSKAQEHTYHGLLLSLLNGMDLEVSSEISSSWGRLDLLIQMPQTSYVIELKLDSTPEAGLKQIISKGYDRPYQGQGKSIVRVGLSFSSDKRNIDTWQGELLDEHGALIRKLAPEDKK